MPMGAATVDGLGELPPESPMQMLRDEVNLGPVGITDKEPRCEASFEAPIHESLQLKPTRTAVSLV